MKYKLTQKRIKRKKYKVISKRKTTAENTAEMTAFAKTVIDRILKSESL